MQKVKKPVSCQKQFLNGNIVQIRPFLPKLYSYAGVSVVTPPFTLENLGLSSSWIINNYTIHPLAMNHLLQLLL